MRSSSLSKTTFPNFSKNHNSHGTDHLFKDDNLRDPALNHQGSMINDDGSMNSARHTSEVFEQAARSSNFDKGTLDLKQTQGAFGNKTQTSFVSKSKRLQPIKSTNLPTTLQQASSAVLKSSEYGVSDFYLKNFLGKQRIETDGRRIASHGGNFFEAGGNAATVRSSTLDNRKAGKSPGKHMSTELLQLASGQGPRQKFYDTLAVSYKEFYMDKKEFMKIFDDIDVAVFCHEEVVERLKCYRFELGSLAEKVGTSYKKILEKMLELTMKISSEKDFIHEKKMEENFQGIKSLENDKKALEEKNKQYKNLSDVTESEANIYKFNVKSLQNEVSMLYELLRKDYLVQDRALEDEYGTAFDPLRPKENAEPSKLLAKNLLTLQESIKHLETEQNSKGEKLQEMNNLLKAMLRGGKKEATTQVDEGELAWAAKNILTQEDYKPKALDFDTYDSASVNMNNHISVQIHNDEIGEGVDPVQIMKFRERTDNRENENSAQPDQNTKGLGAKSAANNGLVAGDNFNLPLSMIIFLENVTKGNKTANVLPWPFFKRIIYEIYQDKIINAAEMQSVLINSSVNMSEYLPIYFLKAHRLRRTAEMKMLEFGVSLKYYLKTWQRAATFANMCNISSIKLDATGANSVGMPEFDIYAQNFYLYAFTKVTGDPTNLYDNSDGASYLIKEKIEEIASQVLAFDNETSRRKYITGLYRYYKTFSDNGKDVEGIDIDKLLHVFMESYFDAKNRNNQALTKQFYKQQNNGEGVLSIDEVLNMTADIIDIESPVQGFAYPKELSVVRAFLYALTSGKNAFAVTYKDFIQGMVRFGIDCPFPFVSTSGGGAFQNYTATLTYGDGGDSFRKTGPGGKKKPTGGPAGKGNPAVRLSVEKKDDDSSSTGSIKVTGLGAIESKDAKKKKEDEKNGNFKFDAASTLFAQHFSIIRELKAYCNQFKESLGKETDLQKVWKGFDQISSALEAGCQFLSYPVSM